jgi:hypothetical protein
LQLSLRQVSLHRNSERMARAGPAGRLPGAEVHWPLHSRGGATAWRASFPSGGVDFFVSRQLGSNYPHSIFSQSLVAKFDRTRSCGAQSALPGGESSLRSGIVVRARALRLQGVEGLEGQEGQEVNPSVGCICSHPHPAFRDVTKTNTMTANNGMEGQVSLSSCRVRSRQR